MIPQYLQLFLKCVEPFVKADPDFRVSLSVIPQEKIGAQYRNFAYCKEGDTPMICISPRFFQQPEDRQEALFLHELGHAWLFQHGSADHTERETDKAAERISGKRIYYDELDVQTTKPGRYPRPSYLPQ